MKVDNINISPNFFRVLREAKISLSAYKLALYIPELIQGGMVNLGQVTGMSQATIRQESMESYDRTEVTRSGVTHQWQTHQI